MQYLIDASVYVFRAHYSIPQNMVDHDGNPINALYGFCRFLGDFVEQVNPEYIAVAFDESLTTSFRTDTPTPIGMTWISATAFMVPSFVFAPRRASRRPKSVAHVVADGSRRRTRIPQLHARSPAG